MSSLTFEAKVWGIDVASVCPCWHEIEIEYFPYDLFATLPLSVQVGLKRRGRRRVYYFDMYISM